MTTRTTKSLLPQNWQTWSPEEIKDKLTELQADRSYWQARRKSLEIAENRDELENCETALEGIESAISQIKSFLTVRFNGRTQ